MIPRKSCSNAFDLGDGADITFDPSGFNIVNNNANTSVVSLIAQRASFRTDNPGRGGLVLGKNQTVAANGEPHVSFLNKSNVASVSNGVWMMTNPSETFNVRNLAGNKAIAFFLNGGTFSVSNGTTLWSINETDNALQVRSIVDATNTGALTIRKNSSGGNILNVDSSVDVFTMNASIVTEPAVLVGSGTLPLNRGLVELTSNAVGNAVSLPNGAEGQTLTLVLKALGVGNTSVVTPVLGLFSTITLDTLGGGCTLLFTVEGWSVVGFSRCTIV